VTREGTVACARRGCGALYHRECWDEVAKSYGGCAVYGCTSKKAKEVSLAGYLARMLRMLVAALLFPPRLAKALRRQASGETTFWRDVALMVRSHVIALFSAAAFLSAVSAFSWMWWAPRHHVSWDGVGDGIAACVCITPCLFTGALAATAVALRVLGSVLRSEVSALARADDPGNTVLGRLREGGGNKSVGM
jgi:hypothetical protein